MLATLAGRKQAWFLRTDSHWHWVVLALAMLVNLQAGCSPQTRRAHVPAGAASPTPGIAHLPPGFSRARDLPRMFKGRPKGVIDASVIDQVSGPVGERLNGRRLEAQISVTQMKPRDGVTLSDVATPLRWGVAVTQTTDKQSVPVTTSRAKFRLVRGRECFQWTSRYLVHLRDSNTREPFLEAALFQAGGMMYMVSMTVKPTIPTTSVREKQYSSAWFAALRDFDSVIQQVAPPVAGRHDVLATGDIEAPPGFMRMAGFAGRESPIGDGQDLKQVYLSVFNGLEPEVPFPARRRVPPTSICVCELVAKRALSLDRWASILRGGVPSHGGVSKGDSDVVRFSPLRKTATASVPILAWGGRGRRSGLYCEVAGAVFSKKGHSYLVAVAHLDSHDRPKGKPDVESTVLDMVKRTLKAFG